MLARWLRSGASVLLASGRSQYVSTDAPLPSTSHGAILRPLAPSARMRPDPRLTASRSLMSKRNRRNGASPTSMRRTSLLTIAGQGERIPRRELIEVDVGPFVERCSRVWIPREPGLYPASTAAGLRLTLSAHDTGGASASSILWWCVIVQRNLGSMSSSVSSTSLLVLP